MSDVFKYVGKDFHINDAVAKVTGELKYASDINMHKMLHIKLILSPIAHGIIKNINTKNAENLPGVVGVFSYKDYHGKKYSSYRTFPDQELCPEDRYIFTDKVRFVGDVVAAVAAEDAATAIKVARLVEVEYEDLPVMVTPKESLGNNAIKIHDSGNLIGEFNYEKNSETPFQHLPEQLKVTTEILTQKMNHLAMETHSYIADYNQGEITIWSPTQGVFGVRTVVAEMLDLPYNKVRVIKVPMGGSFGGKQEFIYEPLVAFIAMKTKRPVKLHLTRREDIIATIGRAYSNTSITTSFAKDGYILYSEVDNLFDSGAYAGSSLDQLHAMKTKMPRLYHFPRYSHHGRVAYTNTPLAGGMRGWGSPEMITALEIHVDLAAKALGLDPVDIRLKNLVEANDIDMCNGLSLGECRVKECLIKGVEAFNWKDRYSAPPEINNRLRRGVGLACGAHKNGLYNSSPDLSTMTIRMNEDGCITLQTSVHDVGCGTVRSMQIIVGEIMGIHPDKIQVTEGDTKYTPYDCGSYGSRVTYVAGACARKTAIGLKEKVLMMASELLNKPIKVLNVKDGAVISVDMDHLKISFKELATRALMEQSIEMIVTESYQNKSNPGAYAVNFAEVEVDTHTGWVKVTDFLSVNDIGQAINRSMVEKQIQGGVQMSLGYGLSEEIAVNELGIPTKDTLRKYHSLNCVDMPRTKTMLIEDGGDEGPFGAKSIGEISTVPGTAAVVNAVNNALGTEITELPLTPERVLAAFLKINASNNN